VLARVYSYDAVGSFIAIPVGEILVGPLAHAFGTTPVLLGCAAVIVVASFAALSTRSVRRLTVGVPEKGVPEASLPEAALPGAAVPGVAVPEAASGGPAAPANPAASPAAPPSPAPGQP